MDRWAWGVTCCVLRVPDAPLPEEDILYPAEPARAVLPSGGAFRVCSPPAAPATAPLSPAGLGKPDPLAILSRNATHPLLHISTLYEAREDRTGVPGHLQTWGTSLPSPHPSRSSSPPLMSQGP